MGPGTLPPARQGPYQASFKLLTLRDRRGERYAITRLAIDVVSGTSGVAAILRQVS
jgi:hypothetical protein